MHRLKWIYSWPNFALACMPNELQCSLVGPLKRILKLLGFSAFFGCIVQ